MERHGLDNEKLIREVCVRRSLWDQKSIDYLNRVLKAKHWEDVAYELDATVEEVKNRWKLLRDSFNREVRNLTKKCSTSSRWIHFDHMSFLLRSSGNSLLPSSYVSQSLTEMDGQNTSSSNCDNELYDNALVITDPDMDSCQPRRKIPKFEKEDSLNNHSDFANGNIFQSQFRAQCSKLDTRVVRHDCESEDYYFLMSLMPSFERLSPKRKMRLKIKMMQDVYEASFSSSISSCDDSRYDGRDDVSLEAVSSGT